MLQDPKLAGLEDEDEAAYLSLMLIIGAADTVGTHSSEVIGHNAVAQAQDFRYVFNAQSMMTTWSFLEAMMSFPEVQKKAQAEIGAHKESLVRS